MIKRCSVLVLLLLMAGTLCFAGGEKETAGKSETTLQIFSMPTNGSGIQSDPFAQYMKDELGLVVDWLPAAGETANQKLQAMMAAGDLPDLICFHKINQAQEAIDAGLLIPLDDHLDKMPNVEMNGKKSLKYFADTLGDGTAYVVGQGINNAVFNGNANWAINLRWDLYKEIGMPPINTMDDMISILSQMQALEPETADGKKTYGFSFWPDWDGNSVFMASEYHSFYGAETWDAYAEYNAATGRITNQLSDESYYKKGLEFFFKLNQAGLLDPDSLTQRFDNARSKYESGRALMSFHGWVSGAYNNAVGENGKTNNENGKGFVSMYPRDMKVLVDQSSPVGEYAWGIGNNKNLDAALKFLDFWLSVDSASIIKNGFEGVDWVMKDGKPWVTEKGLEDYDSGAHSKTYAFYTHTGLESGFYNERTGMPLGREYWPQIVDRIPDNPVIRDYYNAMGISNPFDGFDPVENTSIRIAYSLRPTLDDDTKALIAKIAPIVKTASWKMVFAEDKAEFESLWDEMQEKARGLGLQEVYEKGVEIVEATLERTKVYGDTTIIGINK